MDERRGDNERREGDERRLEQRVTRVEDHVHGHERTLREIAPVAVHLAEMNLRYETMQHTCDRIEGRLDTIHPRVRRAEYALIAIGITLGAKSAAVAAAQMF